MAPHPFVVGHSWVSRLRDSEELSSVFKYIAKPGGNFNTLREKLENYPVCGEADYVYIILGGNDCDSARDTREICGVKDSCKKFADVCRAVFPNAKLIFFQVEDRYDPSSWEKIEDHKRKGNKFNKWLNTFDGKDGLFCIKGSAGFSSPLNYALDGVHLNEVGNFRLAARIQQHYDQKKAECWA